MDSILHRIPGRVAAWLWLRSFGLSFFVSLQEESCFILYGWLEKHFEEGAALVLRVKTACARDLAVQHTKKNTTNKVL